MPHTLPPSWSEVNVPVGTGSLERWQDTHRSYTYHLQLMNIFGLFKGPCYVIVQLRLMDFNGFYVWHVAGLPKKRCFSYAILGSDHEHVRKMRNQKLPMHNAKFFAHVLRKCDYHIPLSLSRNLWFNLLGFYRISSTIPRRQSKTQPCRLE